MSLADEVEKLRGVAGDAKALFDLLMGLAKEAKKTTEAQRKKIERLAKRLDTSSRDASRARRKAEIEQLGKVIDAHEHTLTISGLPLSVREAVRADLIVKRARHTRLQNLEATDFGGILTAAEVERIVELVQKARAEAQKKKFAAEFLGTTFKIFDTALTLAGKFAM